MLLPGDIEHYCKDNPEYRCVGSHVTILPLQKSETYGWNPDKGFTFVHETDMEEDHFLSHHAIICGYRNDRKQLDILEMGQTYTAPSGTFLACLDKCNLKLANDEKFVRYDEELREMKKANSGAEDRDRSK
jgi:cold shock CspA family protein